MSSNEWRTPAETFDPLNDEFEFQHDLAASQGNALCAIYSTREATYMMGSEPNYVVHDDGLRISLPSSARVWCNPPYSEGLVGKFVEKCAKHAKGGGLAVMLLNATTTDTRWFHRFIWDCRMNRPRERVEVRFLPKRIAFLNEQGVQQKSPRYSNMVVVFWPHEVS